MANRFREDVEAALRHLDNHDELTKERTWYRNGPRGSLHAQRNCYKCETWASQSVTHSVAEAAKKRCCKSCCDVDTMLPHNAARAYGKAYAIARGLSLAESELTKAGTDDIGLALSHLENVEAHFTGLKDDEVDHVTTSLETSRELLKTLRAKALASAETLRTGAIAWAAATLSRRAVLRDETNILGVESTDLAVFGPNPSKTVSVDFILGRIYLRWYRARIEGKTEADEAAIRMLEEAVLVDPKQLDFPVEAPSGNVTLLTWSVAAWRNELHQRLTRRLIPLWEENYAHLTSQTNTKLIGIHGDISRDETRSLLAAHPGVTRNLTRLALVPEVVANYITVVEKRWDSDIVEIVEGCDPDLLETVAALWDPNSQDSEFTKLETALHAASAV